MGFVLLTSCWLAAVISMCVAWPYIHTERAWGWGRSDQLSQRLSFVYIPGMVCMVCCTWCAFVVALKENKASFAQNRGFPTNIFIFECSPSRTKVWKHAWYTWYLVPCLSFCWTCMWYLCIITDCTRTNDFCTSMRHLVPGTWCIIKAYDMVGSTYTRRKTQLIIYRSLTTQ